MKRSLSAAAAVLFLLAAGGTAFAVDSQQMSEDFNSIMNWLSSESAEGMAFHSAVTFDPPTELRQGGWGFDINGGLGTIPLHKNTFPTLHVKELQDTHPENNFNDTTLFPDTTMHLRYGLPDRWEAALRLSNMTVPRTQISAATKADGQSNIEGVEIRKHLGGGRAEHVIVYATFDHIHGHYRFFNGSTVTDPTLPTLNLQNQGLLAWNVKTWGIGTTISQQYGAWVPYFGFGYLYSSGYIHTRLQSNCECDPHVFTTVVGDGRYAINDTKELRMELGTMLKGRTVDWYAASEILALGSKSGRAYALHVGVAIPIKAGGRNSGLSDLRDAPRAEDTDVLPSSMILVR